MKKSFGNLDNNIIALINIILAIVTPIFGLIASLAILILETEDSFIRYYSRNMIVASILNLILKFTFNELIPIKFIFESIYFIYFIILVIACIKAYKLEIWRIPVVTYLVEKFNI